MNQQTGKYLIVIGALVILLGILIYFFSDALKWIGKLPGDINVQRKDFHFYFPITTMIVLSILLTLLINIIKRLL